MSLRWSSGPQSVSSTVVEPPPEATALVPLKVSPERVVAETTPFAMSAGCPGVPDTRETVTSYKMRFRSPKSERYPPNTDTPSTTVTASS